MLRSMVCWLVLCAAAVVLVLGCKTPQHINTEADATLPKTPEAPAAIPAEDNVEEDGGVAIPLREDVQEPEEVDETPDIVPEQPQAAAPNADDANLAKRIVRWKKRVDHGIWWECGRKYTADELPDAALEWASAINAAYIATSYKLRSGKVVKVDKKEAVGLMMKETRFDRCAVGPYPRKFAYKHKLLKKRSNTLSHTLEEVRTVFEHPRFQGRLADIGPGQIVKRIGRGKAHIKWDTAQDYLSLIPGVKKVFAEMATRGEMYNTRTPSDRWPGSKKHDYYTRRVLRFSNYIFNDAWYKSKR